MVLCMCSDSWDNKSGDLHATTDVWYGLVSCIAISCNLFYAGDEKEYRATVVGTKRAKQRGTQKREVRRNGQKKEKGERVRDEEPLIRNRLEHTHTHCSDIMGQECCTEEPTTERDGRGGGSAFSLWQGRRRGEHGHGEGVRGYGQSLRLAKAMSTNITKVRCRQVQLPTAKVRVGFN